MILVEEHIRALCEWPHRGTATENETQAADYARKVLEDQEYHVDVEKFRAPKYGLYPIYILVTAWAALACALAFSGSVAAVVVALLPVFYIAAQFYLLWPVRNLLLPTGESQNIIGRPTHTGAKARIILSAHLDTQLGSFLYSPTWVRFEPAVFNAVTVGAVAALLLSILRVVGVSGTLINALLVFDALLLLALLGLFVTGLLTGEYVQGANDDASGVAAILSLAEDLRNVPTENVEVWIVATGAEESGLCGMAHFMRKGLGRNLDKESTYFINFDNLGGGELVYLTGEFLPGYTYSGSLIDIAQEVAQDAHSPDAKPGWWPMPTDALVPSFKRYHSVTLFGYDEAGHTPNYHYKTDSLENVDFDLSNKARSFALDMIRKIDRRMAE